MAAVRKRKWKYKGVEKEAWVVDYFENGKRVQGGTFSRKGDAEKRLKEIQAEQQKGVHTPRSKSITVAEVGSNWILTGEADKLERATLDQYRQHLNLHIVPTIGAIKLSDLGVPAVRKFQDKLRKEGRSSEMIKRVTISLGAILADAYERGNVARNSVREMNQRRRGGKSRHQQRRKKRPEVGVDIPTPVEIRCIIDAVSSDEKLKSWRPLIVTAIFTGLRSSELRGLRWTDVDLAKGVIHVRQRADRYQTIGAPKTDKGQRKVPVPPIVVNTLKEWKLACPRRGKTDTRAGELHYVFPNGKGNPEWHGNIIKRGWIPAQIAAGVCFEEEEVGDDGKPAIVKRAKYPGLHALRHFYASWCINHRAAGGLELPARMVQERMGHASIARTMDVYSHLFPEDNDADALAEAERQLLAVSAS